MKIYILLLLTLLSSNLLAQVAITMPAEYEKNEGVILTWPYMADMDSLVAEISGYAAASGDVWLIFNPDSTVTDTSDIRAFLQSTGNNHDNVFFVPGYSNTFFIREYGPMIGYGVFDQLLVRYLGDPVFDAYNRPADDSIPKQLADYWQSDYAAYNLAFEPGNVLTDGEKNAFVSDAVLEENLPMSEEEIKQQLAQLLNVSDVTILQAPQKSGGGSMKSLDMFMKLLDSETMLITEIPDTLPDFNLIENNVSIIQGMTNTYESPYKIVRVQAAPLDNGKYDTTLNGEQRSYTNALILNNLILIPAYNNPPYDSAAFHLYKDNTYGMAIRMIDATKLSAIHAAIHTITKEKPQEHFLRINHKKIENTQDYQGEEYTITCMANGDDVLDNMWLYYRFNDDTSFQKTTIHLVCPTYYGVIENVSLSDTIHYYLEANEVNGTTVTYPLAAPQGYFSFWFNVTAVDETNGFLSAISIAPNPVFDYFKIKGIVKREYFELFDVGGRKVMDGLAEPGSKVHLNQSLKPGLYLLKVSTDRGFQTIKLLKQ